MSLSKTDIKILQQLQKDARITNQHLADEIGLSASPTWRKVRKLEEDEVIQGYRAVLNRKKIGLNVMVFVRVTIDSHSEAEARKFEQEVMALDNVVSCYSIGGDAVAGGGGGYGCVCGIRYVGYTKIAGDKGDAEYVCAEGDKGFGGLAFR